MNSICNSPFSDACAPHKFIQQSTPVFFRSASLATLTRQHIRIRESAEIVGCCPRAESIYCDKNSYIQF